MRIDYVLFELNHVQTHLSDMAIVLKKLNLGKDLPLWIKRACVT